MRYTPQAARLLVVLVIGNVVLFGGWIGALVWKGATAELDREVYRRR